MQQHRPRKRQKVAEACLQCREKKTKCDGVRPVCDTCQKSGMQAECTWARRSAGPSEDQRQELETLRGRITELESALEKSKDIPHRSSKGVDGFDGPESEYSDDEPLDDGKTISPPTWLQEETSTQKATQAMDGETTSTADGGFGSSSIATFVRQVDKLLEKGQAPETKTEPLALPEMMPTVKVNQGQKEQKFTATVAMPPKNVADHLMQIYWTRVWDMYPFIDRPAFEKWYSLCYTDSESKHDALNQCLFNSLLAVCAQLDESMHPKQRSESAHMFYERAESLVTMEVLDSPRLVLVQALLNMETYLQTTQLAARCWNIAGLAVRVAQRLGIHDEVTLKKLKKTDRETARRIWHSCVLVDRIIATTFGRPFMISVEHAATRPPTIDSSVDETCPSKTGLQHFVWSLKMFGVLARLLIRYYNRPRAMNVREGSDPESDLASALAIDASLTIISDSVPEALKIYAKDPYEYLGDEDYHKSVVLRLRFLHIRMLLFRPILLQLCVQQNTDQQGVTEHLLESAVFIKCSLTCVTVAQDLVALVEKNRPDGIREKSIPAWWYILFYTYTAGIIFIAAQLCPALSSDINESDLKDSINKCLNIFEAYKDFDVASHYKSSLDSLEQRIMSIKSSVNQYQQKGEPQKTEPMMDFLTSGPDTSGLFMGQNQDLTSTAMSEMSWLVGNPSMPSGFTFDDFNY